MKIPAARPRLGGAGVRLMRNSVLSTVDYGLPRSRFDSLRAKETAVVSSKIIEQAKEPELMEVPLGMGSGNVICHNLAGV